MSRKDLLGELESLKAALDRQRKARRSAQRRETQYRAAMVRLLCDPDREAAEDAAWRLYDNMTRERVPGGDRAFRPAHYTREAVITRWRDRHMARGSLFQDEETALD